jgi:Na+-transporting methylmalonyl-CoA/oxaloacetate decarboxylase gamma subunit
MVPGMGAKISVLMFISFVQYGWGSFLRSILKEQVKVKCPAKGMGCREFWKL